MINNIIQRIADVKGQEIRSLCWSFSYLYLLLCAYYIIRPIRNEMAIVNGVDNIQWLVMGAMLVLFAITPLFGWLTSRFKTQQFLSICTLFFAFNLLIFFVLFNQDQRPLYVSRAFYIWVNVFNMFIVSLFWSFMNDIFSQAQSKRLFAFIAAGGTAGALTGPIITNLLVQQLGLAYLLLIASVILSLTVVCIRQLNKIQQSNSQTENQPTNPIDSPEVIPQAQANKKLEKGAFNGIKLIFKSPYLIAISCFIVLFSMVATFLTVQQASLIEQLITNPIERTQLFAKIDFATSVLTLVIQIGLTNRLIRWIGVRNTLMLIPVGLTIGFVLVASSPILLVMVSMQVFRRAGDYAIMKPVREMLFNILSREEKYKAKNFIDTTVLRSSDALSISLYTGVKMLGAPASAIAAIGVTIGIAWAATAYWLGNKYQYRSEHQKTNQHPANQ